MAVDLQSSIDEGDIPPISSINVTPFVDVVLVLLVIFMVTAPMMMKDVLGIRLPRSATGDGRKVTTLGVAVTKNGNVLLNGELVTQEEVTREVKDALKENPQVQAVVSADQKAYHQDVVRAIDWIKSAGLERFAIQIEKAKE